jgi:hypothetical protein
MQGLLSYAYSIATLTVVILETRRFYLYIYMYVYILIYYAVIFKQHKLYSIKRRSYYELDDTKQTPTKQTPTQ